MIYSAVYRDFLIIENGRWLFVFHVSSLFYFPIEVTRLNIGR